MLSQPSIIHSHTARPIPSLTTFHRSVNEMLLDSSALNVSITLTGVPASTSSEACSSLTHLPFGLTSHAWWCYNDLHPWSSHTKREQENQSSEIWLHRAWSVSMHVMIPWADPHNGLWSNRMRQNIDPLTCMFNICLSEQIHGPLTTAHVKAPSCLNHFWCWKW